LASIQRCPPFGWHGAEVANWVIALRETKRNLRIAVMGWVLFEVLLAFGLGIFIVWWTFPRKKKKKTSVEARPAGDAAKPPSEGDSP